MVRDLCTSGLLHILEKILFRGMTLVVVLKQTTAGTNRRSYAIHLDEWSIDRNSTDVVVLTHNHMSDKLIFSVDKTIVLNNVPGFHLEFITCIKHPMNPQFLYSSGSDTVMIGDQVTIPARLWKS
jgi:hypothetical protein